MDKSLDEVIATRPKGIRRGGPRRSGAGAKTHAGAAAKAQVLGTTPAGRAAKAAPQQQQQQPADKIIVSNLPQDVNEVQIKELFHSTVGPLREVTLHYDAQGRSKGVAAVHFQKKGAGTKAYQQYNNRLIDGS
ncbi:hypothetical protein BJ138DRAFT_1014147 [Hygrophoropsis aurantiaca]|uniref:Uncharacterized protein n=1 Tax=Hygrophoropsis aurantiaca TaxID=72124 RepID=A0ACB8A4H1_9AGAM|nr:hypothetical protein BJ138DRAFT_1014147 [Hygrophoropsis aurantiaca]